MRSTFKQIKHIRPGDMVYLYSEPKPNVPGDIYSESGVLYGSSRTDPPMRDVIARIESIEPTTGSSYGWALVRYSVVYNPRGVLDDEIGCWMSFNNPLHGFRLAPKGKY